MTARTWIIPTDNRLYLITSVTVAITESPAGYTVRVGPPNKSNEQRGLFHALCEEIGKALGNTPAEIKTAVKQYHYGIDEKKIGKDWCRILRSTEDDDRAQYTALIEAAYRWASENGIAI